MSKSGSRYGRRSNWFKIHCLLQEQQQDVSKSQNKNSTPYQENMNLLSKIGGFPGVIYPNDHHKRPKENNGIQSIREHPPTNQTAPLSVSSPESHNSDSSLENNADQRQRLNYTEATQSPAQIKATPPLFPSSPHILFPSHPLYPYFYHQNLMKPPTLDIPYIHSANIPANNNTQFLTNHNNTEDEIRRRFDWDLLIKTQKLNQIKQEKEESDTIPTITPPRSPSNTSSSQDSPIDLSIKSGQTKEKQKEQNEYEQHDIHQDRQHFQHDSISSHHKNGHNGAHHGNMKYERAPENIKIIEKTPLDLTTKV